jgi:hypothetical protein
MNSELATASAHRDTTMTTDEENSEICLKLLGLKRVGTRYCIPGPNEIVWSIPSEMITRSGTPAFTTWAEAGMILEALAAKDVPFDLYQDGQWNVGFYGLLKKRTTPTCDTGPLAIRAAALAYIRSLP